ncbi:helix-turn-helix transcriptional regulator [Raoultella ornithinolytica]|nr:MULTISPECIES: helix-turn-helix transcriptional regulator [Enterobacterales]OCO60306.1 hypothetical protein AN688_0218850 [Citrobacter freundii]HCI6569284.1 helix-turn-helix transcriptional regulator [Klebsiella variicola subsp. variicola]HDS5361436.1 helix-turn-helix transcriptional regulator [Klebsiella variicola]HDS9639573.1 helix-turn-helix transcriptional regulator [Klebsiella aerogenes]HDX8843145.1 helix-turn-helix transcriptional regulator [Klebsiella oxytoca]
MSKSEKDLLEDMNAFEFGRRLTDAMSATDDTVSSLVVKTGIPNSTIRSYLKGDSVPGILQLKKLASGMGIKAGWLLGDEDGQPALRSDADALEKDLELLNSMFRYMTPGQRARILKRVLNSISGQLDKDFDGSR